MPGYVATQKPCSIRIGKDEGFLGDENINYNLTDGMP